MNKYNAYKDSGIEWIGEIPEGWTIKRLKHVVREPLKYGANESASDDDPNNPRYIRITDFGNDGKLKPDTFKSLPDEIANDYLLEEGDLLFARSGTVGKTFLFKDYKEKACYAGYLIKASVDNELLNSSFLAYLTKGNYYENWKLSSFQQATIQNIGADKYNNLFVPVPSSFNESNKIANYLDHKTAEIDTLIKKKKQLIALYKEERTATINAAVTGKIDVTKMSETGLDRLKDGQDLDGKRNPDNQKILSSCSDRKMKDSGIEWIGEIPEEWEVTKLKFVTNLKSGENIVSEQISKSGKYPVYGGNGLRGYFDDYTHSGNFVLIGRQGALCGNVNYTKGDFWASEHAVVCSILNNHNFVWLGNLLEVMNLNQYSQSSAQPGLAVEKIKNLHIPAPSEIESQEIGEFINDFKRKINHLISKTAKEIDLLQEYKTALISEVVLGKVDVREEKMSEQNF